MAGGGAGSQTHSPGGRHGSVCARWRQAGGPWAPRPPPRPSPRRAASSPRRAPPAPCRGPPPPPSGKRARHPLAASMSPQLVTRPMACHRPLRPSPRGPHASGTPASEPLPRSGPHRVGALGQNEAWPAFRTRCGPGCEVRGPTLCDVVVGGGGQ